MIAVERMESYPAMLAMPRLDMIHYVNSVQMAEGIVMIPWTLLRFLFRQGPATEPEVQCAPKAHECKVGQCDAQGIFAITGAKQITEYTHQQWTQPHTDKIDKQHLDGRRYGAHIYRRQGLHHG
jgi:hypothetical protein